MVFVRKEWVPAIRSVGIARRDGWANASRLRSDHVPVSVDIDLDLSTMEGPPASSATALQTSQNAPATPPSTRHANHPISGEVVRIKPPDRPLITRPPTEVSSRAPGGQSTI